MASTLTAGALSGTARAWRPRPVASLVGALALSVGLAACGDGGTATDTEAGEDPTVDVVAAFYPLAFLAERVGGDLVQITDLTPAGGHAHDLELSPRQVSQVGRADMVIYLGESFQPAVEDAVAQSSVTALDGLTVIDDEVLIPGDFHVWLDPTQMALMGEALAKQLGAVDPSHAAIFENNAKELRDELEQVDAEYRETLAECSGESIVTSHEAFGYMTRAYDLNQVGIMGLNPDAEPSPARLRELEAVIEETGATTVFFETQTASSTEQKLADALSMRVGQLETLESAPITADDYVGALRANLDALREGLDCTR